MWHDEAKSRETVLVEGFFKARQGGVCGKVWFEAVSTVLVEGFIKARQGEFGEVCDKSLGV